LPPARRCVAIIGQYPRPGGGAGGRAGRRIPLFHRDALLASADRGDGGGGGGVATGRHRAAAALSAIFDDDDTIIDSAVAARGEAPGIGLSDACRPFLSDRRRIYCRPGSG